MLQQTTPNAIEVSHKHIFFAFLEDLLEQNLES